MSLKRTNIFCHCYGIKEFTVLVPGLDTELSKEEQDDAVLNLDTRPGRLLSLVDT